MFKALIVLLGVLLVLGAYPIVFGPIYIGA
jgi:hypothetical protein